MLWKEITFSNTNDGDNVYTCHGPARAFSKIFYKKMKLKFSYGEDMYSYLFSAQSGNKYHYVKNTHIYYQSPKTFSDHFKQSQRFRISIKIMSDIFGEEFIQNNFKINTSKGLKTFIKRLSTNPVYLILYLLLNVFISLGLSISKSNQNYQTWPTVKSSKFTINT
jgi:hypothetical protein